MFQKLSKPKVLKQGDNHLNATHCNPKMAKTMNKGGTLLEKKLIISIFLFLVFLACISTITFLWCGF
jgi:hypothetical protein